MALTSGFYNSINGDRKYDAEEMSAIFNGIINDGIFQNIGDHFAILEVNGMIVRVGSGRAWFSGAWIYNDGPLDITVPASDTTNPRIDTICLVVDHSQDVRAASIELVSGTPSATPAAPTITNTTNVRRVPLYDIFVNRAVTAIAPAQITNRIGTSVAPFVTGILATVSTDELLVQWQAQFADMLTADRATFDAWFVTIQDVLDANTAGNLLNLINQLRTDLDNIEITTDALTGILPVSKGGTGGNTKASGRGGLGITSGTAAPSGGDNGDIYIQY